MTDREILEPQRRLEQLAGYSPKRHHWIFLMLLVIGQVVIGISALIEPVDLASPSYSIEAPLYRVLGFGLIVFALGILQRSNWGFIGSGACWASVLIGDLVFEGTGAQLKSAFDIIAAVAFAGAPIALLTWLRPIFVHDSFGPDSKYLPKKVSAWFARQGTARVSVLIIVPALTLGFYMMVAFYRPVVSQKGPSTLVASSTSTDRNWVKVDESATTTSYLDTNSIRSANRQDKRYQQVMNFSPQFGRAASFLMTVEVNCGSMDHRVIDATSFSQMFGVGEVVGTIATEIVNQGNQGSRSASDDRTAGLRSDPKDLAEYRVRERALHTAICQPR